MNMNLKTSRPGMGTHTVMTRIHGDVSRRVGNVRALTLNNGVVPHVGRVGHTDRAYREIPVWKPAQDADNRHGIAMYVRAAQLQQLLITWVLTAGDEQAMIYECRKTMQKVPLRAANTHPYYDGQSGHVLVPVPNGIIMIANYRVENEPRDMASGSDSVVYDDYLSRRRFIRAIADKLQQAYANNSFDRLVLLVPARMLVELGGQLSADVQDRIIGKSLKDHAHYQNRIVMAGSGEKLTGAHLERT